MKVILKSRKRLSQNLKSGNSMNIIWSNFAIKSLKEIFLYYKQVAGSKVANKIKNNIFNSTKQLIQFPKSGQIEEILKELNEEYRYLVTGNHKIIYKEVKEGILIIDIFDTRQNPIKMKDPNRNKES